MPDFRGELELGRHGGIVLREVQERLEKPALAAGYSIHQKKKMSVLDKLERIGRSKNHNLPLEEVAVIHQASREALDGMLCQLYSFVFMITAGSLK